MIDALILREPVEVENKQNLFLEESERKDPTLPNVATTDVRDDIMNKTWTKKVEQKRIRSSLIIIIIFGLIFIPVYSDFSRQRQTGGFQGVYLGDKKILWINFLKQVFWGSVKGLSF